MVDPTSGQCVASNQVERYDLKRDPFELHNLCFGGNAANCPLDSSQSELESRLSQAPRSAPAFGAATRGSMAARSASSLRRACRRSRNWSRRRICCRTTPSGEAYMAAGDRFLEAAVARGLAPHHRVLDIGCGVGRFAVALAGYLDERGSYVGIDTHAPSLRLSRKYIGRKLDRFKFKRVPFGEAATLRFPFPSASFDFVFSNSLFTHLMPDIAENYLLEIGRVLRPRGRAFNTMFLLNPDSVGAARLGFLNAREDIPVRRRTGAREAPRAAPGLDRSRRGASSETFTSARIS